jgi:hypothetical protein
MSWSPHPRVPVVVTQSRLRTHDQTQKILLVGTSSERANAPRPTAVTFRHRNAFLPEFVA